MSALLLGVLALLDAAFAGFRASAGRDGRIRKAGANARASRRGLSYGAAALLPTAALAGAVLLMADDPGASYRALDQAGWRMLAVYLPYTGLVAAGLFCYLVGPFRLSTLAMVVGLGPLTLVRVLVVLAGAVAAGWGCLPGAGVAVAASVGVLLVEPLVHRRWYAAPL